MSSFSLPFILSVISTLIVFKRWTEKHRPYLMAWGIGLLLYFIGSLSQVILALTWSPLLFGLWYWSGALMVAPWLGQGTIFLLVRRGNIARNVQMLLILVSIMTLPWTLLLTPMNAKAWYPGVDMTQIYKDHTAPDGTLVQGVMTGSTEGTVRLFAPVMNMWGTLALVGGAIYSSWIFGRKNIMRNRVVGNWLIAAGGLLPALGGVLITLGNPSFKYLGDMLGAILIFAGFWLATHIPEEDAEKPTHAVRQAQS